jgi:hypothetical protein
MFRGKTFQVTLPGNSYAKYYQTKDFFDRIKPVQEKICAGKLATEDPELASRIDFHAIRVVNELLDDLADDHHNAETIENRLNIRIQNASNNEASILGENGRQYDLTKSDVDHENDDWMSLKFNGGNYYYLDPKSLQHNDTLDYLAVNKKYSHIVFAKGRPAEFKNATHELYISQDDGLGRYKIQTKDDVLTQFFVPTEFISYICDKSRQYMSDFKKVQGDTSSDIYHKQMMLNNVQDRSRKERTLNHLKDLKQKIDKSLNHKVLLVQMPDVKDFDDFYNEVVDGEKEM